MNDNKLKILVIDDNQDYLEVLKAVMARMFAGSAVFTATSGQKGITLALAEAPDVILLDIAMPEMNGFEVCRRLKADDRLKNIPVVFLTAAKTDQETRIKALEAGGEGFLPKPFEVEELVAQVRAMAKIKAAGAAQEREKDRLEALVAERTRELEKELADRKRAEAEREKLREQFLQSQKMEAIGHMAGGVAHDFNNILTAILGYASFLSAAIPAGTPKCSDVDEIIKAGERAAVLTHQLLTFSRKQVVQFRVLDLNSIVPEILRMLRRMIPEDITFEVSLNSAPAPVLANQGQIEQVIMNLAVNARDAMPDGGKLTIGTALAELDGNSAADLPGVPPGRYVMLAVSDSGQGMNPEIMERIFEPFFTTKEQGKGTGLGLSTVYGIVRQSNGSIFVHSEPGKGATFKIYFPIAAEKAVEKPAGKPSLSFYRGTETILVVEDEESVRKLVCRVLSQSGYSVLEAATPREAITLCERRKDIRLLLTDLVMPLMNGYELARVTTAASPLMKVIFMSGYTKNIITRHDILEPGMVLLEKPLKVETILRKVREVLEGSPQ